MLLQGILLGISLSFMVGPLMFAIVNASLERGLRGGLAVAAGIWLSDLLFMSLMLSGVDVLSRVTALPGFRLWAGLIGGLLLIVFGIASLFSKRRPQSFEDDATANHKHRSFLGYFLGGFLLNTINPFTLFFWLSIASAVIIPNGWNVRQALVFFSGMLGMVIGTDILKAYGAKLLRRYLTVNHIVRIRKGIGLTLIVFGLVLMIRVL